MSVPNSILKYQSNRAYLLESIQQNKVASLKRLNKYVESVNSISNLLSNNSNSDENYEKIMSMYKNSEPLHYSFISYHPLKYFAKSPEVFTEEQMYAKYTALVDKISGFKLISIDTSNFRSVSWELNISIQYQDYNTSTAYKYDFGRFRIGFTCSISESNEVTTSIVATPVANNKPCPTKDSVFHPHIKSNGSVCIGSYGGKAIKRDLINYDLLSVVYNISSVLCEYNPHSLQDGIDITAWIGNKCAICQAFISDAKQQIKCAKTFMFMHRECAVSIDNELYSPFIVKECAACGKQKAYWIPEDGKVICRECKESSNNEVLIPLGEDHEQRNTDQQEPDEYDDDDNGDDTEEDF